MPRNCQMLLLIMARQEKGWQFSRKKTDLNKSGISSACQEADMLVKGLVALVVYI